MRLGSACSHDESLSAARVTGRRRPPELVSNAYKAMKAELGRRLGDDRVLGGVAAFSRLSACGLLRKGTFP